jgi:hypothetical protein
VTAEDVLFSLLMAQHNGVHSGTALPVSRAHSDRASTVLSTGLPEGNFNTGSQPADSGRDNGSSDNGSRGNVSSVSNTWAASRAAAGGTSGAWSAPGSTAKGNVCGSGIGGRDATATADGHCGIVNAGGQSSGAAALGLNREVAQRRNGIFRTLSLRGHDKWTRSDSSALHSGSLDSTGLDYEKAFPQSGSRSC